MAVSLPTFVNNSVPPIDATFLNNISRAVELHDGRLADIRGYGATAGGDAAAAVTAAISALGSAGGIIYLPSGDWLWNSVPKLPKNLTKKLHVRGEAGTKVTLTSGGLRFLDFDRTADYDTFQNIEISDLLIDVNNLSAPSSNHVVVGMQVAGSETTGQRVNVKNLLVQRIRTINVPVDPINMRRNVWIISRHLGAGEATQTSLKDITVKDCDFAGGTMGVVIAGTSAGASCNVFLDNILVEDIKHDCLTNPSSNYGSSHVHIGSEGFGGTCTVKNIWGFGSRDVGIEINAMSHAIVDGFNIENANGFYFVHAPYNVPANPGGQQIECRNCKAIWSGGTHTTDASSAFAGISVNGNPLGSLTFRDCSLYKSDPKFTDDGIAMRFMGEHKKIVIDNFEYVDDHIDISAASASPTPFWFQTANKTQISMKKIRIKLAGVISTGTISQAAIFGIYGSATLDWDDILFDISGIAAGNHQIRGFNIGQITTVLGPSVIRRAKFKIADATTPDCFRIWGVSTLTFDAPLRIVEPDFSALSSLGNEVEFVTAGENVTNIAVETGSWVTAAPTVGSHIQGESVRNISPVAGGNVGWVCVAAGTPGTWKPFGVISA